MIWFELLPAQSLLAVALTFVFSLLIGSFLNVVIYRLPIMMEREWQAALEDSHAAGETAKAESTFNLATPRSACRNCGHQIAWYENIPLLSWLWLKGRCSACQTPISMRYPCVELLSALLVAIIVWQFGLNTLSISLMLLTWALITLSFIDIDHHLLPDAITLPLLWLGLLLNSFELFTRLDDAVWGAALGYLILWGVYWLFKLITGKEGMGYGDFKLLAALGAWGGVATLPLVILFSSVAGVLLAGLLILLRKHDAANPLPFGPYLAIAGWVAILWGGPIVTWYLG
ncbi:prepilin peptidase [Nitrincola tapanii]|uniref:Prepilin leader peptidase/N-methyltransferase n=1 Tax=Nitrincola tapanii TaxID=1708751 RepID=A0A5A9W453_9GAMM|nr:A24 family peptidase [Nitrincola tapanii]KAA0875487.1 prepilin peptidase [Nitrincola tapanii]